MIVDLSILAYLVREYKKHCRNQPPVIIYDIDDILWPLIWRVATYNGIDPARAGAIFTMRKNIKLTPEEQEAVIASFGDPRMFEDIPFYPGVEEILRPRELGAIVRINSNSFNEEIARLKIVQLLEAVPGLKREDIQMNIISYAQHDQKPFTLAPTFLCDDSPHNQCKSEALIGVMPRTPTWSLYPPDVQAMAQARKCIVWQDDLIQMNEFVYRATEHLIQNVS